ncbi:hypothetical protein RM844_28215 [Streptomyces sp. DSM 44915]|uniref:Uncharacterized protein n=1 Tax=Streptomyces chisholmiae TaxID=3075540 RepID=A0ABU2JYT9_9ACTN|nr:hypothetical protein [Streptomyces sp. DSM 44915]MDT0270162.1 hypothetical protein [Streptomyces sp. DSM 44915]
MPDHHEDNPNDPNDPSGPAEPTVATGRWRRRRPLALGALLGLLLGAGTTLGVGTAADRWDDAPSTFCWGALSRDDLAGVLSESMIERSVVQGETPLGGNSPQCQLVVGEQGLRQQLTVTVGWIDAHDVTGTWAERFLHPELTPYPGDPVGLAGPRAAWVRLPPDCHPGEAFGRSDTRVVSVVAEGKYVEPADGEVARTALRVANAALDHYGCHGRYATDDDSLAEEPPGAEVVEDREEFCGTGTQPPDGLPAAMLGTPGGPVRVCSGYPHDPEQIFRLVTVEDPGLAAPFLAQERRGQYPIRVLECGAESGVVLAQSWDRWLEREGIELTELLDRYAATEAERLGCQLA